MAKGFLADREKALEESFFAKQNKMLLERLRAEKDQSAAREGLAQTSGIQDAELLDKLADLEISASTWAAISLVPLVEVAWADGRIEEKERRAVLGGAEANGVDPGTPSYELLQNWLTHRPDARLFEAWGEYIVDLCAKLAPSQREALREQVVGRARTIAEAAGGILGLVNTVSPEEQLVLQELEKAFTD